MINIFAEFISPTVSQLHHSDPLISSIHYDHPSESDFPQFEEIFTEEMKLLLHQISKGISVSLNEEQSIKMRAISILLGNEELFNKINEVYPIDFNLQNVELYLQNLRFFYYLSKLTREFDFSDIVKVVAENFYQIDPNILSRLPKSILYSIISHDNLKLKSEDSLLEFIISIFSEENDDIISFFEKVYISNLSDSFFNRFLERIEAGDMSGTLWHAIRNRFIHPNTSQLFNSRRYLIKFRALFDGNSSNRFRGIIHKLTEECGGNVKERGIVDVTSSSISYGDYKCVVDFENLNSHLGTSSHPNSWIQYDFKEKRIIPTHYSIRSCHSSYVGNEPRDWAIEASNDARNWQTLDTQNGITCIYSPSVSLTFEIQQSQICNHGYQYIRLKGTGINNNQNHNNHMRISALEFFGTVI